MFYVCLGNVGLYAILGPTSSKLQPTWGHVGPTLDRLGLNFPHLGSNLSTNGAILVPTWRLMRPPWCQLGPTKRHMEPIKSDMKSIWRRLAANLWIWIGSWSDLGPSWMQAEHVECEKSLFFQRNLYVRCMSGKCQPLCNLGASMKQT